jgi:very-short-patch-repair endonuclease
VWGTSDTLPHRALAAVLSLGTSAMTSHRTSAALWDIGRPAGDPLDLLLTQRTRFPVLPGVVVHRPRDLLDLRPILRQRVPTTNPIRMLVDLGAVDENAVANAMIAVMSSKAASPAAIRAGLLRHAKQGRHGVTALRRALEEWLDEELPPDSELEAAMVRLLRSHRLPAVEFHARVIGFEVDFLVVGTTVVLECDGWVAHGLDHDQFEFDRIRTAELLAAGYPTVHFTWAQLQRTPDEVAHRIRRVLERWAPQALGRSR